MCALVRLTCQYRLATAAGLKPEDVKVWLTANGLFQALFERRSTHNELLKRSGDVIRFAASSGMLTLEYVAWQIVCPLSSYPPPLCAAIVSLMKRSFD